MSARIVFSTKKGKIEMYQLAISYRNKILQGVTVVEAVQNVILTARVLSSLKILALRAWRSDCGERREYGKNTTARRTASKTRQGLRERLRQTGFKLE